MSRLEPLDDLRVLYAFHFYDPWPFCDYRVVFRYTEDGKDTTVQSTFRTGKGTK